MKRVDIEEAAAEATRFLRTVNAWVAKDKELESDHKRRTAEKPDGWHYRGDANVEHAAMKRASMDLTRALARMRRPE